MILCIKVLIYVFESEIYPNEELKVLRVVLNEVNTPALNSMDQNASHYQPVLSKAQSTNMYV